MVRMSYVESFFLVEFEDVLQETVPVASGPEMSQSKLVPVVRRPALSLQACLEYVDEVRREHPAPLYDMVEVFGAGSMAHGCRRFELRSAALDVRIFDPSSLFMREVT